MRLIWIALLLFISECRAQSGGYYMGYTPIDAVTNSLLEKEIRIDFKGRKNDIITRDINPFIIEELLSHEDNIRLRIGNEYYIFKEKWQVYEDYASLLDQYLYVENRFVKKVVLKGCSKEYLRFDMYFYDDLYGEKPIDRKQIIIDSELIKGLLSYNGNTGSP